MKYILLLALLFSQLLSAPALNIAREFTQADGSTFKASAKGDEYLNWIESEDGEILKYNKKTKNFEYAEIKNERLAPSGEKYSKKSNSKQSKWLKIKKIDKNEMYKLWKKKRAKHRYEMIRHKN